MTFRLTGFQTEEMVQKEAPDESIHQLSIIGYEFADLTAKIKLD